MSDGHEPTTAIDVSEHGAQRDGKPQVLDKRLFMQLLVFTSDGGVAPAAIELVGRALAQAKVGTVIYEDVNDPFGFGVLTFSEDPADFVTKVRPAVAAPELPGVRLRPDFTMLGRSYSSGFEPDLEHWV